ncbi:TPA: hypothetical protein N0F65_004225 [Lagenidium giganteum]|uniref:TFIID subunit TAF5 NTD2 domain-containing protein n=1 Tax=Lagenidium giganteum TaxID=4803 RepID=A0AAV2ZBH7_9STRA|nr:TPA: hypothetical protein N0F65_004225 [Lagenidium giganteum]
MNMTNMPAGLAAAPPTAIPSASGALSPARTPIAMSSAQRVAMARKESSMSENGADMASPTVDRGRRESKNAMDELLLQYLRKRGYKVLPDKENSDDVDMEHADQGPDGGGVLENGVHAKENQSCAAAQQRQQERIIGGPTSLEQYAQRLGLSTESCAANHVLFYGLAGGDSRQYEDAYVKLSEWICNSLDMYKYELHAVAYPLFVHCFLELVSKGFSSDARDFFWRYQHDHMRLHVEELRQLGMIFSPEHIETNEYAQQVLHSKFNVQMSLLSFELLNTFLSQEQLFVMLAVLNERVNIIVTSNQPALQVQHLDDSMLLETKNMSLCREASSYKSSDDIAKVVADSNQPNESEIVAPLTSGSFDLEYMVHSAGGEGDKLEDLHAIRVQWGVLPPRRLHADKTDDSANGGGEDANGDGNGAGASGNGGGAGDSGSAGAGADSSKKDGTAASDATGDAAKSGDKNAKPKSGDKGASADAQRKAKRAKISADSVAQREKSELDVGGPVPDRKSPFHAEIMEKLVIRQPAEMKVQSLEDLKTRAPLSKAELPSSLCFTFLNSSTHINNICFSNDVTMVGASCDDGSFRVWRNDDQPLGTATGCVYHGNSDMDGETDEDEKMAVLRGHSSAVYGAAFSPDNRFALTSSADSTIRLWSLAARNNMVIYRSHSSFPVWDVEFGPHGYYFASCSMDRTARLWSTDHVSPLRIFAGHLSDVDCVKFHPNHHYLATGSSDKTVRLWDFQSGKCIRIFTGHFHGIKSLAFSRNGRYLASSGDDQYINVWDLQAGKRLETLVGHKATVTSLDFSQESTILASAGMDSTVRLWDMKSIADKPSVATTAPTSAGPMDVISRMKGSVVPDAHANRFVKPVQMVRPSAVQDLPPSRYLLKTLRSKQTPMYRVQFTPRNLLLSGGVFHPKMET